MLRLVERFPLGRRADDALYDVARELEDEGRTEWALEAYDRLRRLEVDGDFADSARLRPAMMHYARGERESARDLWKGSLRVRPGGPFEPEALFWLGRIAREEGDESAARAHWTRLAEDLPCDYFGLRARQYLHDATRASVAPPRLWLAPQAAEELRARYAVAPTPSVPPASLSHRRVDAALREHIYARAKASEARLVAIAPGMLLPEISLSRLDRDGLWADLCVSLALRQDALAASRADPRPESVLALALALEREAGEWSLALELCGLGRPLSVPERSRCRIIRCILPPRCRPRTWTRHGERRWSGSLPRAPSMPSRARRAASTHTRSPWWARADCFSSCRPCSHRSMPATVCSAPDSVRRSSWATPSRASTWPASGSGAELFPVFARNTDLVATFPHYDFASRESWLPFFELFAVMEHHAGRAAMQRWQARWQALGRSEDLDFVVTSIPYGSTRRFTQGVAADMMLARAGMRFDAEESR